MLLRSRFRVTGKPIRNRSAAWETSWKPKRNWSLIFKSTIHISVKIKPYQWEILL